MNEELAVVFDVAGTLLEMCRVAKDIPGGCLIDKAITAELIMAKSGRALVVPQMDPEEALRSSPDTPLSRLFSEDLLEISCSSTPVDKAEAKGILRRSRAKALDLQEAYHAMRSRCPKSSSYRTAGVIVDIDLQEVAYALSTGGVPFPGVEEVLARLRSMGAEIFVASGDSMRSLSDLSKLGLSLDRITAAASPRAKEDLVKRLKKSHKKVVMVGDGLNDIYALRSADIAVLTVQQESRPSPKLLASADWVARDIRELPEVVERAYNKYYKTY